MIKPSKYKSVSVRDLKNRTVTPISNEEKNKVITVLNKLTYLIKQKHS